MRRMLSAVCALFLMTGCQKQTPRMTVLIGATSIQAAGARPIEDSVIVVAAGKIRAIGERRDVPVPQNSDRVDFTGRWIVPAPGSRIAPGEAANLIFLNHAPNGIEPANASDVTSRMSNGEWIKSAP